MGCYLLLEDDSGSLLLEDGSHLLLENCVPVEETVSGGWAEQAVVRENEIDLVTALLLSRPRRRLRVRG